jgi:hypothetical protein
MRSTMLFDYELQYIFICRVAHMNIHRAGQCGNIKHSSEVKEYLVPVSNNRVSKETETVPNITC